MLVTCWSLLQGKSQASRSKTELLISKQSNFFQPAVGLPKICGLDGQYAIGQKHCGALMFQS